MKSLVIYFLALILAFQLGCTSQARKTHLVFENENATYEELHQALEDLKPVGHEGSTHLQFKAVKTLRHIAKYMDDPAKREMGVRALVFLAAFNDDRDVRKSCESRLDVILTDYTESLALRGAIIDEQKNIIMSASGYTVKNQSFFSGQEKSVFIRPEKGALENALEFLTSRFTDLPEYLQYRTVQAFGEIMHHPVTCHEKDGDTCIEYDSDDLGASKIDLKENIGDWLEDTDISDMIKMSLVRLVEESQATVSNAEADEEEGAKYWLKKWAGEGDIPESTRNIIQAALNKIENIYPELSEQKSQNGNNKRKTFEIDQNYRSLDRFERNAFWYANTEKILEDQLFISKSLGKKIDSDDTFLQVPAEWIIFDGYRNNEKQKELREIVFYSLIRALNAGYLLSRQNDLVFSLENIIRLADKESIWALDRTLSLVGKLYPSLLERQLDVRYLADKLTKRIAATQDLHARRLYYYLLVEGMPYFQSAVEPTLCESLKKEDLLTRHIVKEKVMALKAPLNLLTKNRQIWNRKVGNQIGESFAERAGDKSLTTGYFQSFCGEPLTDKGKSAQ